jgi:hypothetical protein
MQAGLRIQLVSPPALRPLLAHGEVVIDQQVGLSGF